MTGRMSNNTLVHFKGDASLIGTLQNVYLDERRPFLLHGNTGGKQLTLSKTKIPDFRLPAFTAGIQNPGFLFLLRNTFSQPHLIHQIL